MFYYFRASQTAKRYEEKKLKQDFQDSIGSTCRQQDIGNLSSQDLFASQDLNSGPSLAERYMHNKTVTKVNSICSSRIEFMLQPQIKTISISNSEKLFLCKIQTLEHVPFTVIL